MKTLCIYGCGGMGREIADLAYRMSQWEEVIFIDDNVKSRIVDEVSVFTLEEALNQIDQSNIEFIVAAGEPSSRKFLYEKLEHYNLEYVSVIDSGLNLSRLSSVKNGTIVHTGATITVNVHIGKGCLINKHVVIGHDVNIGDYTVISPNASIGGDVNIASNCYIGSGAIIRNGINIGQNSIIGMGAVVLKDVDPNSVMVGNPAKLLKKNTTRKVFGK
ncbi:acetyltransferase [Alkaliphilus sp. B6464]|uniref:acetyltransferase n=1 Tax=Alkaliphilus sp. B6464 TaxID=2731219 RepID=UPI001BAD7CF0|nr:acetyltransferase [Alkaliphilus sp. B6464]QUH19069.1 acetyltransferase [Alkaliphilus sp. B6464]